MKNKSLISLALFGTLVLAQSEVILGNELDNDYADYSNNAVKIENYSSPWYKIIWKIAKYGYNNLDNFISIDPSYDVSSSYVKVGSGSIKFNRSPYGGIAEHTCGVSSTYSEIDGWAERIS